MPRGECHPSHDPTTHPLDKNLGRLHPAGVRLCGAAVPVAQYFFAVVARPAPTSGTNVGVAPGALSTAVASSW